MDESEEDIESVLDEPESLDKVFQKGYSLLFGRQWPLWEGRTEVVGARKSHDGYVS